MTLIDRQPLYKPLFAGLLLSLERTVATLALVVVCGFFDHSRLGSEFIPNLDEGDIAMRCVSGTRVPLDGMQVVEIVTGELPEVERVFTKIGTAE
jgi:cobalt-zinc-cadmium resistance protein CzcA